MNLRKLTRSSFRDLTRIGLAMAMPGLLSILTPLESTAQYNTMWHDFRVHDVKNYTTKMVPGAGYSRESVMAGTAFDRSGNAVPHFMILDDGNTGTPVHDYPGVVVDSLYPDPNFLDLRTMDVVPVNDDAYFIIVSAREDGNSNPSAKDKIKLIKADGNASNVYNPPTQNGGERVYYDNTQDYNLYPMNGLYNATHELLYICGYVTTENTVYPFYPDENSAKQSFIMAIDVSNADPTTWNVTAVKYFESSPAFGTGVGVGETGNPIELDFDMAMRMQIIENGTWADNIFMTGSVNAMTGTTNGGVAGNSYVRSATMVHVLDPVMLTEMNGGDKHIIGEQNSSDGDGRMEYGIGMFESESTVGTTNGAYYIVSNMYAADAPGDGMPANDWYNTNSFNAKADRIVVTHVDEDFKAENVNANSDRLILDIGSNNGKGFFALNVLSSTASGYADPTGSVRNTSTHDRGYTDRFIIAGMIYGIPENSTTCDFVSPSFNDINDKNIEPFTMELEMHWARVTGVTTNDIEGKLYFVPELHSASVPYGTIMTMYESENGTGGTGNHTIISNAYSNLGGGLSHMFYGPKIADRDAVNDINKSLVVNAPKLYRTNPDGTLGSNMLGLKTMFSNATNGTWHNLDGSCLYWCDPVDDYEKMDLIEDVELTPVISEDDPIPQNSSMGITLVGDCWGVHSTDPAYKPTKLINVTEVGTFQIYPNPAQDQINMVLKTDMEADALVNINLVNMQGQLVKELYNGTAGDLQQTHTMQLPQIANGLYWVQVYSNGQPIYTEKLSIEQ